MGMTLEAFKAEYAKEFGGMHGAKCYTERFHKETLIAREPFRIWVRKPSLPALSRSIYSRPRIPPAPPSNRQ